MRVRCYGFFLLATNTVLVHIVYVNNPLYKKIAHAIRKTLSSTLSIS
jgi:hypothetical protein